MGNDVKLKPQNTVIKKTVKEKEQIHMCRTVIQCQAWSWVCCIIIPNIPSR